LKENLSLQGSKSDLISAIKSLNSQKKDCKNLHFNLKEVLEQLCSSEYNISKFLKTLEDQEDIHSQHLNLFRQSENLLSKYYQEALRYCLKQIEIRDKQKVSVEIQTELTFEEVLADEVDNKLQKKALELGNII